MERPESATKVPEADSSMSVKRYFTFTLRPRSEEYAATVASFTGVHQQVNSTEDLLLVDLWKIPGRSQRTHHEIGEKQESTR